MFFNVKLFEVFCNRKCALLVKLSLDLKIINCLDDLEKMINKVFIKDST